MGSLFSFCSKYYSIDNEEDQSHVTETETETEIETIQTCVEQPLSISCDSLTEFRECLNLENFGIFDSDLNNVCLKSDHEELKETNKIVNIHMIDTPCISPVHKKKDMKQHDVIHKIISKQLKEVVFEFQSVMEGLLNDSSIAYTIDNALINSYDFNDEQINILVEKKQIIIEHCLTCLNESIELIQQWKNEKIHYGFVDKLMFINKNVHWVLINQNGCHSIKQQQVQINLSSTIQSILTNLLTKLNVNNPLNVDNQLNSCQFFDIAILEITNKYYPWLEVSVEHEEIINKLTDKIMAHLLNELKEKCVE